MSKIRQFREFFILIFGGFLTLGPAVHCTRAAAPQNARHNASWCNFVDCIIFSTRRLELRERRQNALLQHDWSIVNWVKRPWIVGTIYEFRDLRARSLFLHIRSNTQTWIYESRIHLMMFAVCFDLLFENEKKTERELCFYQIRQFAALEK